MHRFLGVLKNHLRRRSCSKVVGPAQDGRVQRQSMGLTFISANLHQFSTLGGSVIQLAAYSGGLVQLLFGNQNLHTRRPRMVLRGQKRCIAYFFAPQYCTILYYTILYYTVLYHTILLRFTQVCLGDIAFQLVRDSALGIQAFSSCKALPWDIIF